MRNSIKQCFYHAGLYFLRTIMESLVTVWTQRDQIFNTIYVFMILVPYSLLICYRNQVMGLHILLMSSVRHKGFMIMVKFATIICPCDRYFTQNRIRLRSSTVSFFFLLQLLVVHRKPLMRYLH